MPVHDVAADQPELALQVERRMDLPGDDRPLEVGRVFRDRIDDQIGRRFALIIP